jgi:uncharacterized protein
MMIGLLKGIVGSTAYGLNGPDSDIDTLAVGAIPTENLFKLSPPKETIVTTSPDTVMHDAGKYARLALKCNPTVTELVWLDDYLYQSKLGKQLVDLRTTFLSERLVRDAYLGYAKSQLTRLQDRDHKRATKHAMHMARLVNQGAELYTCGELTIKVDDPEWYFYFKTRDPEYWLNWYNHAEKIFRESKCVLPEHADETPVQNWLYDVRRTYYDND